MYTLVIFLAALAVYLPFNGLIPITDPVESNYALTAKEMLLSGDLLSPRIYGQFWYDKPAMIYWLIAFGYKLFGVGEFGARFPASLFGAASVAYAYWLASELYSSKRVGIFAALVVATSLEYWILARMIITDAVLFFFTSVALGSFYLGLLGRRRAWYVLAYGCAGLAVLTKGPVGLVLPGMIIFAYIIVTRQWRLLGRLFLLPGLAVFLVVAAPWYYAMYQAHGKEFIDTFLGLHNYLRATVSEHPKDNVFYYYLVLFPVSMLPWTGMLLKSLFNRRLPHFAFLTVWLGVFIVFYTMMATKYPTYVFPAIFPAALLIAAKLDQMEFANRRAWLWLSVPALLLFAVFAFGVRYLPAANWWSLYLAALVAALVILWLQLRGKAITMPLVVSLGVVAISLIVIYNGLVPLAETRSAKWLAPQLPATGAEVAAFGEYQTSAVFYTGYRIPKLTEQETITAVNNVWSGKYTMPTESMAAFDARTANKPETYIITTGEELPLPDFRLVDNFGKSKLYQRNTK